jgi:hypothetical protein
MPIFLISRTPERSSGRVSSSLVVDGNDYLGFFGPANSSLVGDTFTLIYTFDTSKGAFDIAPQSTQLYGGSGETGNFPSPGFAVLTINGSSVLFDGNVVSQTQWANVPNDPIVSVGSVYTTTSNIDNSLYVSQAGFPALRTK